MQSDKESKEINMLGVGIATTGALLAGTVVSLFPLVGAGILAYKTAETSLEIADAITKHTPLQNAPRLERIKDTFLKTFATPVFGPSPKKSYRIFRKKRPLKAWAGGVVLFGAAATIMTIAPYVGIALLTGFIAKRSIEMAQKASQLGFDGLLFKSASKVNSASKEKTKNRSLIKQALMAQDTLKTKEAYLQARSKQERIAREEAVAAANAAGKPLSANEVIELRNKEEKKRLAGYKKFQQKRGR